MGLHAIEYKVVIKNFLKYHKIGKKLNKGIYNLRVIYDLMELDNPILDYSFNYKGYWMILYQSFYTVKMRDANTPQK